MKQNFLYQNQLISDIINYSNNLRCVSKNPMEDISDLEERLADLEREHKDLDDVIDRLRETPPVDFLQIKRLQKKKLHLKDLIQKIRSDLLPDIIA